MTIKSLLAILQNRVAEDPRALDTNVQIEVKTDKRICGGTPCVSVKQAYFGFDWDHGRFILVP